MTVSRRDLLLASAGPRGSRRARPPRPRAGLGASRRSELQARAGRVLARLALGALRQRREDSWLANTKKFTEATGVEVRVDKESWEDIRPKAAVAANVGSGPDIMLSGSTRSSSIPDKLLDVTDIAQGFAGKYGGYFAGREGYAKRDGKFIALPIAAIGNGILYRESMLQQAGFSKFPEKSDAFLEMCKALKAKSQAGGLRPRQGGRRRQQLRPLDRLEPRRQDGRRGRQGGHQLARDHQGVAIRPRALPDLRSRHRELARHQQQRVFLASDLR